MERINEIISTSDILSQKMLVESMTATNTQFINNISKDENLNKLIDLMKEEIDITIIPIAFRGELIGLQQKLSKGEIVDRSDLLNIFGIISVLKLLSLDLK